MSSDVVKQELLAKLKQEHCFWSYNENSIKDIPDDMLIEKTLLHLDLEEINQLFLIYPFKKIKQVWLDYLVPQAEYLYTLNRFFAWYYFKAKKQAEIFEQDLQQKDQEMYDLKHELISAQIKLENAEKELAKMKEENNDLQMQIVKLETEMKNRRR